MAGRRSALKSSAWTPSIHTLSTDCMYVCYSVYVCYDCMNWTSPLDIFNYTKLKRHSCFTRTLSNDKIHVKPDMLVQAIEHADAFSWPSSEETSQFRCMHSTGWSVANLMLNEIISNNVQASGGSSNFTTQYWSVFSCRDCDIKTMSLVTTSTWPDRTAGAECRSADQDNAT